LGIKKWKGTCELYMNVKPKIPTRNIVELQNKHKGARMFLIGNGPSLNKTNFELVKDKLLFGCNGLFVGLKYFNIMPQYYMVSDSRMWEWYDNKFLKLDTDLILGADAWTRIRRGNEIKRYKRPPYHLPSRNVNDMLSYMLIDKENFQLVDMAGNMHRNTYVDYNNKKRFSRDLAIGTYCGGNVMIDMLQVAYCMGCSKVYLIGCDFNFEDFMDKNAALHFYDETLEHNKHVHKMFTHYKDANYNHFKYTRKCFEFCDKVYKENGREIIDCTVGGKLGVFKHKTLEEVIGDHDKTID